jgi:hypothetical protein
MSVPSELSKCEHYIDLQLSQTVLSYAHIEDIYSIGSTEFDTFSSQTLAEKKDRHQSYIRELKEWLNALDSVEKIINTKLSNFSVDIKPALNILYKIRADIESLSTRYKRRIELMTPFLALLKPHGNPKEDQANESIRLINKIDEIFHETNFNYQNTSKIDLLILNRRFTFFKSVCECQQARLPPGNGLLSEKALSLATAYKKHIAEIDSILSTL